MGTKHYQPSALVIGMFSESVIRLLFEASHMLEGVSRLRQWEAPHILDGVSRLRQYGAPHISDGVRRFRR
jgi:hypothetical protein